MLELIHTPTNPKLVISVWPCMDLPQDVTLAMTYKVIMLHVWERMILRMYRWLTAEPVPTMMTGHYRR